MTYWSFKTLDQDMEKMEGSIEGRLYLSRYVAILPANSEADEYLGLLEKEGYLPLTVSWISDRGTKGRLYFAPEGAGHLDITCNGMAIEVLAQGDDCVLVKSARVRRQSYQVSGDPSFQVNEPTKLPMVTYEVLRLMALMGGESQALHWREV